MGFGSKMLRSRSNSLFGRSQPVSYEPSVPYDHPGAGMGGGMGIMGGMDRMDRMGGYGGGAPYHPAGSSYAPSHYGGGGGYSQGYGPERGYGPTTPYMGGGGVAFPSMDGPPGSEMALIPSGRSRSRRNSLASSMFPPPPSMVDDHEPFDTVPPPPSSIHTTRSRRNSFGGGGILPPGQDMYSEGYRSRRNSHYGGIVPGSYGPGSEYGYDDRGRSGYRSRRGSQSGQGYYGSEEDEMMPFRLGEHQRTGMYYSGGVMKRVGFFNRRGDQLWDNDGSYKPAHPSEQYPPDLAQYPLHGWMDETGRCIEKGTHRLVHPGSRRWREIMGM